MIGVFRPEPQGDGIRLTARKRVSLTREASGATVPTRMKRRWPAFAPGTQRIWLPGGYLADDAGKYR